ncbi:TetR/AcrR family transcriptional regulator [Streptomyces sp. NPDC026672]|uniref:TetR/AcrR family transcriptional regulator n=1 Tax=unclassified Streptomyces TaxID=2593676 RepID=UPI003407C898
MAAQRADARRNYLRILSVAQEEVAAHGAGASLEQIARTAGVGSATVRRHFPTRNALLRAVFRERLEGLAALAREAAGRTDTDAALLDWLTALTSYAVSARGLAAALASDPATEAGHTDACSAVVTDAAGPLLRRAASEGLVPADLTVTDVLTLVAGIALATEHRPDPATAADRLLRLVVRGIGPRG